MALTYGFYNSVKGDRKYDAMQFSEIIDTLIIDGIIPSKGQLFAVTSASNGMQINIGTGMAWFFHSWTKNDSVMVKTIEESDITRPRIDAVVLEVDRNDAIRANSIKVVKGEPAVNPAKPTLVNTEKVHQYPLAYVTVPAAAEEIKAENIENMVGREPTVFATGVLETVSLNDLWSQWEGEWDTWFSAIKLQLSGDIVTNLQLQIDELKTANNIKVTNAVAQAIGIPAGSTVDYTLKYLNQEHINLINAIKNSADFVKTADYTTAGSHTHTAKGTKGFAILIGGGAGGGGGGYGGAGGGGGGGSSAEVKITNIVGLSKNATYNIVVGAGGSGGRGGYTYNGNNIQGAVGSAGGSSSAFSYTASGGNGGKGTSESNAFVDQSVGGQGGAAPSSGVAGGYGGSGGQNPTYVGSSGADGTMKFVSGQGQSASVYSGGGGGASGMRGQGTGGAGSSDGGGKGGNGGKLYSHSSTVPDAPAGSPGTIYGSGGGGGGGGDELMKWDGEDLLYDDRQKGGKGGDGKNGRVIIYESGIFNV